MTYLVKISDKDTNGKDCAFISVLDETQNLMVCCVDINLSKLIFRNKTPLEAALDLLLIASTVYTLDRSIERKRVLDNWTRRISVKIPVHSAKLWTKANKYLSECLNFLSGDEWEFIFENRTVPLYCPKQRKKKTNDLSLALPAPDVASLFSGGVDSLAGTIDWLESNADKTIALVGHHDPTISGVNSVQQRVFDAIYQHYGNRIVHFFSGIGPLRYKRQEKENKEQETTTRSRSFLFLSMGIFVADMIGQNITVLIPENGTIALNVPLTPSRRGACSTRTAHPHYLNLFQRMLETVKLSHCIINPLLTKTKGEVLCMCQNLPLIKMILAHTVSCAKCGHTRWWKNRNANSCGACMPCIYRRAAFHKFGVDSEVYGYDICAGDIDPDDRKSESANDLRACLFFLSKNYSLDDIAQILWTNGNIASERLQDHVATISRAMEEIRQLFRDKGTKRIKQLANL